jgi:hypothetical protein
MPVLAATILSTKLARLPAPVLRKEPRSRRTRAVSHNISERKQQMTQTQRRPGRIAQAVAVICWYWTKAIALKREPRHPHFCPLVRDPFVAIPGKPGSFGDELRRAMERFAIPRIGRNVAAYGEDAVASPAARLAPPGRQLGSKARCLRPQSPHVTNNSNNLLSSAGSTSFPVFV